jgi:hypothetical protein
MLVKVEVHRKFTTFWAHFFYVILTDCSAVLIISRCFTGYTHVSEVALKTLEFYQVTCKSLLLIPLQRLTRLPAAEKTIFSLLRGREVCWQDSLRAHNGVLRKTLLCRAGIV